MTSCTGCSLAFVDWAVHAIKLVPFAAIDADDVRRADEPDRETLRNRAAHAGPIDEDTLVYRVEFHVVGPED